MTEPFSHDQDERERPVMTHGDSAVASLSGEPANATTAPKSWHPGQIRSLLRVGSRFPIWAWLRVAARFRIRSGVLLGFFALIVYLAAWLPTVMRSFVFQPQIPQLDQRSMDPNFFTWAFRWWPYAIQHGLNPLHPTLIGAPKGFDLAWITSVPPLALLAWPVTAHYGSVVSFNLLASIALPLSAWAAFLLCRRLTGRFLPALAGGAIFGFSAYQADHNAAGQVDLTFSLLLPLIAYLIVVWWQNGLNRWVFTGLLALAFVLQFYLFLETFAELTGVLVLALLAGYALAGHDNRASVLRLGRLVGVAYLICMVFAGPYLVYALTHIPKAFQRYPDVGNLDLASLVEQRPDARFSLIVKFVTDHATRASLGGYVGVPLLALAVLLILFGFRRAIVRFLFVMLVVLMVVALGPVVTVNNKVVATLPWHSLWHLPILRAAYPVRFMVFGYLALAVMVAIWLAGPWPRLTWFSRIWQRGLLFSLRWLVALVAVAAVILDLPAIKPEPLPAPKFITADKYQVLLHRGERVIVQSQRGNAGLLWQAQTDFYYTLAGGYVSSAMGHYHLAVPLPLAQVARLDLSCPPAWPTQYWTPAALECAQSRVRSLQRFLNSAKVGAIIIESAPAKPLGEPGNTAENWPLKLDGLGMRVVERDGVWIAKPRTVRWRLHVPRVYKRPRHLPSVRFFPRDPGSPRVTSGRP